MGVAHPSQTCYLACFGPLRLNRIATLLNSMMTKPILETAMIFHQSFHWSETVLKIDCIGAQ